MKSYEICFFITDDRKKVTIDRLFCPQEALNVESLPQTHMLSIFT
jgi:hypothetical protein